MMRLILAAPRCRDVNNTETSRDDNYRAVNKKCPGERHIVEPRGFFN